MLPVRSSEIQRSFQAAGGGTKDENIVSFSSSYSFSVLFWKVRPNPRTSTTTRTISWEFFMPRRMKSRTIPTREGQGPSGLGVGSKLGNRPTPALRDPVKSSQDFTFAPPLRWRGSSSEVAMRAFHQSLARINPLKAAEFCLAFACNCLLALSAFAQVAAETKASSPPRLSRAEMEEFLLTARVVQKKELSMGITNSHRAILDDGRRKHDAHIQTVDIRKTSFQTVRGTELNFRDSYKFNMAAYELDKLLELNMVPVSVERKVGGNMAAVTWWVDDALMTELDRNKKKMEPPHLNTWNPQMYVCRVFDQLIYNTDRNLGNLVITKDWKIWMIDHTRAFRMMKDLHTPQNLVQCDRKLLAKMRELNKESLTKGLKRYLNSLRNRRATRSERQDCELLRRTDREEGRGGSAF